MSQTVLSQIEQRIQQLPAEEQLLLISRVAQKLRKEAVKNADFEAQITAMAADEDIQAELRSIDNDFSVTEFDGLAG